MIEHAASAFAARHPSVRFHSASFAKFTNRKCWDLPIAFATAKDLKTSNLIDASGISPRGVPLSSNLANEALSVRAVSRTQITCDEEGD